MSFVVTKIKGGIIETRFLITSRGTKKGDFEVIGRVN
jgi:hypothetical protein